MENHKPSQQVRVQRQLAAQAVSSGVTFTQPGQTNCTRRQTDISKDKCFNCSAMGHHAKDCPNGASGGEKTGTNFFNVEEEAAALEEDLRDIVVQEGTDFFNMIEGVGFMEVERTARKTCDRNKAYLDTCCTNHTCFASEHLKDIHITGVVLKQHCNAGTNMTAKAGFWRNIKFWLNKNGIANLISAPQLESDGYKLEYKSGMGWLAHGPDGKTIMFKRDSGLCGGMPFIDLTEETSKFIVESESLLGKDGMATVQTVRENFKGYTRVEVRKAKQAWHIHQTEHVSAPEIANANKLFGPDLGGVRGKTVRQRPSAVRPEYVRIPQDLYERHKFVTLTADVMFVNGLPFLVTRS
eukprot:CCRYP_013486-RA/>CCRYP_013486-RA protein AED:0.93 eAED:0.93 QI:0/0/0/0.5/0/0/2/0/352